MSENHEQGIVDLTPNRVAQVDQLRAQARDGMDKADRFMAMWDDGAGGVFYTGFAGDAGGEAVAFFAYCAGRSLKTFAQIMELDTDQAIEAVRAVLAENEL